MTDWCPSKHLLDQSQQKKHYKNVWNTLKAQDAVLVFLLLTLNIFHMFY